MVLDAIPREVLAVVAGLAILWILVGRVQQWMRSSRLRRRWTRAAEGEREAAGILEEHGYTVEAAQVAATYVVEVDGSPVEVALRADYLVRRGRELFVAEVKTGQVAPRIQAPATRRQLLEYHVAFGTAGVLLVDAETRRVSRIVFPPAAPEAGSGVLVWTVALAAIAIATFVIAR